MKKLLLTSLVLSLTFGLTSTVFAADTVLGAKQNVSDAKQQVREAKQNLQSARQDAKQVMKDHKASMSAEKQNRAKLTKADLTAINGTTLTVSQNGKMYTIMTDANTKIRRHYGGAASLAELSVGNQLDIRGTFTDTAKTMVLATTIRDRSIMKFRGAFIGDVVSKNGNTFVLSSKHRGEQTVTVSATAKYVNRKQEAMTLNDLVVGHRVRVKGVWDKSNNTVTQVTQVKDFSLPPKATGSANTNSSASATVTP